MDDTCVPIPRINRDQCAKIVEKKFGNSDYEIVQFQLYRVDERNGYLGEHFRLTINVTHDIHGAVDVFCFAKFLPDNPAQREFATLTGSFRKEVFVYETLVPKINAIGVEYLASCAPECYFTQLDYVLVFEDVCRRGFVSLDRYGHLDYVHILVIVKQLAKFHAASLILEEKLTKVRGKAYRLIDEYPSDFYESFYVNEKSHRGGQGLHAATKGLQTAVDLFPDAESTISDEEFKRRIPKACTEIFQLVKPSTKFRNVVCHGDLWRTNFMMRYEDGRPSECILLDFQIARYLPPSHDFMAFLHLTTTRQFRRRHLGDLQRVYYSELQKLLSDHGLDLPTRIPYTEFSESCEEQWRFAVVQTATYVQMTQVREEVMTKFATNLEKWNTALYVDRSVMVTENCASDPVYKEVLREAVQELRYLCEQMGQ